MSLSTRFIVSFFFFSLPGVGTAQSNVWSDTFIPTQLDGGAINGFGSFFPIFQADESLSGYSYQFVEDRADGNESHLLGHFDRQGSLQWAVRLQTDGDPRIERVEPAIMDPNRFFAIMAEADPAGDDFQAFHVGLFNADDLSAVYTRRLPIESFLTSFTNTRADVHFELRTGREDRIDVLNIAPDGSTAFHKRYRSPQFETTNFIGQQRSQRDELRNGEALTTFSRTAPAEEGAARDFIESIIRMRTQANGMILGEVTAFDFMTDSAFNSAEPWFFPDQSVLYIINAAAPIGDDATESYLIKLSASGDLQWARTITGTAIEGVRPIDDRVYLQGLASQNGEADLRNSLLRLNPENGELMGQIHFARPANSNFSNILVTREAIYMSYGNNFFSDEPDPQVYLQLNADLEPQIARTYTGVGSPLFLDPDSEISDPDQLLLSIETENGLQAFSLGRDLQPLNGCNLFLETTPELVSDFAITESALPVSTRTIAVDVEDLTMPVEEASFELSRFNLTLTEACPSLPAPSEAPEIELNGASITLRFQTTEGFNYLVQKSATLTGFQTMETIEGSGEIAVFSEAFSGLKNFYQIVTVPSPAMIRRDVDHGEMKIPN